MYTSLLSNYGDTEMLIINFTPTILQVAIIALCMYIIIVRGRASFKHYQTVYNKLGNKPIKWLQFLGIGNALCGP